MWQQLVTLLADYSTGKTSLVECYAWLSSIGWDEPELRADQELRDALGLLELLATEAVEGLRDEREFYKAATALLANRVAQAA